MLSHVSIGVKDLAKARSFYDAALKPLGYKCVAEGSGYVYYGVKSPEFGILAVKHPVPANAESGLHFCFGGPSALISTRSTLLRSSTAVRTTASRACAPTTARTTTWRS
jgi:catechol 2,3-dioxygenase-like lactoylglutathione lyase family enzyme